RGRESARDRGTDVHRSSGDEHDLALETRIDHAVNHRNAATAWSTIYRADQTADRRRHTVAELAEQAPEDGQVPVGRAQAATVSRGFDGSVPDRFDFSIAAFTLAAYWSMYSRPDSSIISYMIS